MIVNFKIFKISQDTNILVRIPSLIKKKLQQLVALSILNN